MSSREVWSCLTQSMALGLTPPLNEGTKGVSELSSPSRVMCGLGIWLDLFILVYTQELTGTENCPVVLQSEVFRSGSVGTSPLLYPLKRLTDRIRITPVNSF